jgi:hypothetical protein
MRDNNSNEAFFSERIHERIFILVLVISEDARKPAISSFASSLGMLEAHVYESVFAAHSMPVIWADSVIQTRAVPGI